MREKESAKAKGKERRCWLEVDFYTSPLASRTEYLLVIRFQEKSELRGMEPIVLWKCLWKN